MDWTEKLCYKLIDTYRRHPILWDKTHDHYFSFNKKMNAWRKISIALKTDVISVRRKMSSLLSSFRAQRQKMKRFVDAGHGLPIEYSSKWFAFERMRFLLPNNVLNETVHVETPNTDKTINSVEYNSPAMTVDNNLSTTTLGEFENTPQNSTQSPGQAESAIGSSQNKKRLIPRRLGPSLVEARRARRFRNGTVTNVHQHIYKVDEHSVDRFSIYGQHIANKLRTYPVRLETILEHAINNLLFEADMGNYDAFPPQRGSL